MSDQFQVGERITRFALGASWWFITDPGAFALENSAEWRLARYTGSDWTTRLVEFDDDNPNPGLRPLGNLTWWGMPNEAGRVRDVVTWEGPIGRSAMWEPDASGTTPVADAALGYDRFGTPEHPGSGQNRGWVFARYTDQVWRNGAAITAPAEVIGAGVRATDGALLVATCARLPLSSVDPPVLEIYARVGDEWQVVLNYEFDALELYPIGFVAFNRDGIEARLVIEYWYNYWGSNYTRLNRELVLNLTGGTASIGHDDANTAARFSETVTVNWGAGSTYSGHKLGKLFGSIDDSETSFEIVPQTRGDAGYVIGSPSSNIIGLNRYAWEVGDILLFPDGERMRVNSVDVVSGNTLLLGVTRGWNSTTAASKSNGDLFENLNETGIVRSNRTRAVDQEAVGYCLAGVDYDDANTPIHCWVHDDFEYQLNESRAFTNDGSYSETQLYRHDVWLEIEGGEHDGTKFRLVDQQENWSRSASRTGYAPIDLGGDTWDYDVTATINWTHTIRFASSQDSAAPMTFLGDCLVRFIDLRHATVYRYHQFGFYELDTLTTSTPIPTDNFTFEGTLPIAMGWFYGTRFLDGIFTEYLRLWHAGELVLDRDKDDPYSSSGAVNPNMFAHQPLTGDNKNESISNQLFATTRARILPHFPSQRVAIDPRGGIILDDPDWDDSEWGSPVRYISNREDSGDTGAVFGLPGESVAPVRFGARR